jgi:hypothetical protein
VARIQCLWPGYSVGGPDTVSVARIQCLWPGYSVCGQDTLSVARIHCLWPGYSVCGQDTVSAVIESNTFCMYGSKNVVNEAKTPPGLKYL